jgi:hypothetical protein
LYSEPSFKNALFENLEEILQTIHDQLEIVINPTEVFILI